MVYEITLPWPNKGMGSNSRKHWAVKAGIVRNARSAAYYITKEAQIPCIEDAVIEIAYYPPDKRKRDCQNMPFMCKAYIDGISDAMGCDDHGFRVRYPDSFSEVRKGGEIAMKIYPPVASIPIKGTIS